MASLALIVQYMMQETTAFSFAPINNRPTMRFNLNKLRKNSMNLFIVYLEFIATFLTVFALCMAISHKVEQARDDLRAWQAMRKTQQELAEAEAHTAWRGNKEMVMY